MAEEGPSKMELVEVKADDILPERRAFYDRFMVGTTWAAGATVVVLVLMWIFLV
ncbi:aa3-type cytochrome c oxidase subunit IV [Falsiroseomonas oryziterrae]|uniref:aa3-type cytochrome c oxidase subunit IV n=1 Tax=Falsiroseomonas oryziterrae TaxID=2911368 RepID=UPI001F2CF759|nr:aa3-type cytochrome c oxidase subunit IV [Roseomonas sp. NPKOSM-4]